MTQWDGLSAQSFLNLETFRKNGEGVKTPVWFVQDENNLYVRTIAGSGKVKRIHRSGKVQVAPCKVNGDLLGDWIPAQAHEVMDENVHQKVDRLLDKKYGLQKKLFGLAASLRGRPYTVLELTAREEK